MMDALSVVSQLRDLASEPQNREVIVQDQGCLPGLVLFLDHKDPEVLLATLQVGGRGGAVTFTTSARTSRDILHHLLYRFYKLVSTFCFYIFFNVEVSYCESGISFCYSTTL